MPATSAYTPFRPGESAHLPVRGLRYHVRCWGDASMATAQAPALVLLHGWMDVGASFQFVVDELARLDAAPRQVVAVDWRGFGGTAVPGADTYWFPDYLGDLDALLDALSPVAPVDLAGHSMGGNVAMSYAGIRPARVRRLVNLEGFGLPDTPLALSPQRLARWLDELKTPMSLRPYARLEDVAERLRKNNPRLAEAHAHWLASHWAELRPDGLWHVLGDPAHKRVNPTLYRAEEAVACWRRIASPVLWMEGAQTNVARFWGDRYPRAQFEERLAHVADVTRVVIDDCGHMLHLDQPAQCARHLQAFIAAATPSS